MQHLAGVETAELVGERPHRHRIEPLAQAERIEHLDGVGAQLDTRAHFAEFRRLLVDPHPVAALDEAGSRCEATETGAGDQDLHGVTCVPASRDFGR